MVRRLKGGLSVEQPIAGDELRAFRRYLASREDALPWLFLSERGQPFTRQSVNYLVATAAARAGLASVHPHTLRHSCGFALPRSSRSETHGSLRPNSRTTFRRTVALTDHANSAAGDMTVGSRPTENIERRGSLLVYRHTLRIEGDGYPS